MPTFWEGATAAALVMVGIASIAERRRMKRDDLDNVGFMPWNLVLILSGIAALIAGILASKGL